MPVRAGAVSRDGKTRHDHGLPLHGLPAHERERLLAERTLHQRQVSGGAGRTRDRRPAQPHAPFLLPALHELAVHAPRRTRRFREYPRHHAR